jgi:hypothetical protein
MLLTPEQMQDAMLRMEADLPELHTIVGRTVFNQATLTETVAQLAGTLGDLAAKHGNLTTTVDILATKVDSLATIVDRYIRAQGNGHGGQS